MTTLARLLGCLVAGMSGVVAGAADASAPEPLRHRWVWVMQNLQVDASVDRVASIMRRAKAAGYNGIVLSDYKLSILDLLGENTARYMTNLKAVADQAKSLGLELIPTLTGPGYASGLLAHDPNLAEGLPVHGAPYVVQNGEAMLVSKQLLANGNFEQADGDRLGSYGFQDGIGTSSFIDRSVYHEGTQSLRMQDVGTTDPVNGNCRVMQPVAVQPWRQYRLSVWVRTEGYELIGEARAMVLDPRGQALSYNSLGLKSTQDWTQANVVFNSLGNEKVSVYLGVWGGKGGTLWWDDARLEEIGLVNVLRRQGCPLEVKGERGTVYAEGRDYEPVQDPRMGSVPWPGSYEVYHPEPPIRLTAKSRIRDGERLSVSFFHAVSIYSDQVAACLGDPKLLDLMRQEAERINAALSPSTFFLGHDEIRVIGHDLACTRTGKTPGQLVASNVQSIVKEIRRIAPRSQLLVWSDMFDPYHNAVDRYYLANGPLKGSWEGVPKDAVVVNWNSGRPKESLGFFAERGFRQVLAGYYDGKPESIRTWLEAAKGISGIDGVMYTTWQGRYDDLEAFARAAWGQGSR